MSMHLSHTDIKDWYCTLLLKTNGSWSGTVADGWIVDIFNPDDRYVELTSTTVDNWDSYDAVYIGYPIWWGIAAWPMDSFVEVNDFTGKTVIPFCTATSSGIGESGELLAGLAGTGDWQEGKRFQSSASAESVKEWVEGLEY